MSGTAYDTKPVEEQVEEKVEETNHSQGLTPNQLLAAYHSAIHEHNETIRDAARVSRKAVGWMLLIGMITLVDRLHEAILQGFQSMPAFQKEFGELVHGKGAGIKYTLTATQQQLLSNIPEVFHVCGLLVYGWLIDRVGNRYAVMACLFLIIFTNFIVYYAINFPMILVGTAIHTLLVGFVGPCAAAWCLELSPLALRPYVLIYIHLTNNIGQVIAAGMGQKYADRTDPMGWRILWAIQWAFPVPLAVATFWAPESPWWLTRRGKHEQALKNLGRLHNGSINDEDTLALIQHTVELERQLQTNASYLDCFKGTNLRRTEIAFMAALALDLSGFGMKGAVYFLEAAGISASNAFALHIGQASLGMLATAAAALIIRRAGRRGMWLWGTLALTVDHAIVGALALVNPQTPKVIWPQGIFVIFHKALVSISVGSLSAITTAEIGSVRLRRKTQALGLIGYDVAQFVSGAVSPYLINPNKANLKGKAAWIPAGLCLLLFIYGFFRFPEVRGRNSEEIDILFANKVPARKFATYKIDTATEFGVKEDPSAETERVQREVVPTLD